MRKSDRYRLVTTGEAGDEIYIIVDKTAPEGDEKAVKEQWHNPEKAHRRLYYWNALEYAND